MTTGAAASPIRGVELDHGYAMLVEASGERLLSVPSSVPGFDGPTVASEGGTTRLVRRTAGAAARLREIAPALRPRPFGTGRSTFGFGDRLGLATPGHVRALRQSGSGLAPILAQQSARELARTGRSFRDVLDAATWGALESGWTGGYGADADHLRTEAEVDEALDAGFTMLTLDPSTSINEAPTRAHGVTLDRFVQELPWHDLEDTWHALKRRYAATGVDGIELARTAATFGFALARIAALWRRVEDRKSSADIEIAVDESLVSTSAFAHRYIVRELGRLGVRVTSLAPRPPGVWQKGVDVAGDLGELAHSIRVHASVAAEEGMHKLSVHSGSDKFALYPLIADADACNWHVKTSGTSYLEALRVAAVHDTRLFRDVVTCARAHLSSDRLGYEVAPTASIPDLAHVDDAGLKPLLDDPDARQCLHVTFGSVLSAPGLSRRLRHVLVAHAETYESVLVERFRRHLDPLRDLG